MLGFGLIGKKMATGNPFDLLGDDDNDDPSQLIAAQQQIIASKKAQAPTQAQAQAQPPKPSAKLPSKPLPPAQAGELSIHFELYVLICVDIDMGLFGYVETCYGASLVWGSETHVGWELSHIICMQVRDSASVHLSKNWKHSKVVKFTGTRAKGPTTDDFHF